MGESGRSKGQRLFLFGFMALIAAVIVVPIAAQAGTSIAGAYSTTVLSGQSNVTYVEQPNGSQVAFSHVNGTYAWTNPAAVTNVYLTTGLTVNDLQGASADEITFHTTFAGKGSLTFGTGNSPSSFLPYSYAYGNLSGLQVSIPNSALTGSPSAAVMLEVNSSATSYAGVSFTVTGNSGLSNWFGPAAAEDMGYIIGGIIVWVLGILAIPWYDLEVNRVTGGVRRFVSRKGRGSRRGRRA